MAKENKPSPLHGLLFPISSKGSFMMRWVVGSILHGGPIELFLIPASAPRLVHQDRGMCYPVCGMMHIKEPLLLIGKSSQCGGSGFPHWVILA